MQSIYVSSYAALEKAVSDPTVTHIVVCGKIDFAGKTLVITNHNLTILGQDAIAEFCINRQTPNTYANGIEITDSEVFFRNIRITNFNAMGAAIKWQSSRRIKRAGVWNCYFGNIGETPTDKHTCCIASHTPVDTFVVNNNIFFKCCTNKPHLSHCVYLTFVDYAEASYNTAVQCGNFDGILATTKHVTYNNIIQQVNGYIWINKEGLATYYGNAVRDTVIGEYPVRTTKPENIWANYNKYSDPPRDKFLLKYNIGYFPIAEWLKEHDEHSKLDQK